MARATYSFAKGTYEAGVDRGVQMKVSSLEGGCSKIAITLLILHRFKQTLYPRVEDTKGYPRMGLS